MPKDKQRVDVGYGIVRTDGLRVGAAVHRYLLLVALVLLGILIFVAWGHTSNAIVAATLIASVISTLAIWLAYRSERITEKLEHFAWPEENDLHKFQSHEAESEVLIRALEVFGESRRAIEWMRESNPALHGKSPLRAMQTAPGREEVLRILGRIEHGVIS